MRTSDVVQPGFTAGSSPLCRLRRNRSPRRFAPRLSIDKKNLLASWCLGVLMTWRLREPFPPLRLRASAVNSPPPFRRFALSLTDVGLRKSDIGSHLQRSTINSSSGGTPELLGDNPWRGSPRPQPDHLHRPRVRSRHRAVPFPGAVLRPRGGPLPVGRPVPRRPRHPAQPPPVPLCL